MPTAVDFESYYDSHYSLKQMNTWNYVFDKEKFDAYLVSIHNENETWVGHPKDYDWSKLDGDLLIIHNASFDGLVIKRLQQDGIIDPELDLSNLFCTADLSAYLGAPRWLGGAVPALLEGREASKEFREYMKGRTMDDAIADGKEQEAIDYVASDAINCYDIWKGYHEEWPESEQQISRLNRAAQWHGIHIDVDAVDKEIEIASQLLFDVESKLPWTFDGEKPLSRKSINAQGRKEGIPVPASLAADSPDAQQWELDYGEEHPWILAVRDWRKINALLKKLKSLRGCTREEDNTFPYELKYFGAHTGRFSAGGDKKAGMKFNILNMYRFPPKFTDKKGKEHKFDLRNKFIAREGYCYLLMDYSQIEALLLLWRAGDFETLELVKKIGNLYIADAKKKGEDIKKGTDEYQMYKAKRLGLGYQCGGDRFQGMARDQYGIDITNKEAHDEVKDFRTTNPKIVNYWRGHTAALAQSVIARDETHEVALPSGRTQTYYRPIRRGGQYKVQKLMGGHYEKCYGGLLTENEIQAIGREILCEAWVKLAEAGYTTLFTVYDEFVIELPMDKISVMKRQIRDIVRIATTSSPWLDDRCPLGVEWELSYHYKK